MAHPFKNITNLTNENVPPPLKHTRPQTTFRDSDLKPKLRLMESELDQKDRVIGDLSKQLQETRLEADYRGEQFKDQQKWLNLFLNNVTAQLHTLHKRDSSPVPSLPLMRFDDACSALSDNLASESHETFLRRVNSGLQKIESMRLENFNLKKQIAYDQKKYLDLKNAFVELRTSLKLQDQDMLSGTKEVRELLAEKSSLQGTLKTLSDEVEFLSKKNEDLLKDLKTRDFYSAYHDQSEELTKLREAHTLLIKMIQTKDIVVTKQFQDQPSSFGPMFKRSDNYDSQSSFMVPLKRLLTCKGGAVQQTFKQNQRPSEQHEALGSIQVEDIDQYIEVVLRNCRERGSKGVNFMESSRMSKFSSSPRRTHL